MSENTTIDPQFGIQESLPGIASVADTLQARLDALVTGVEQRKAEIESLRRQNTAAGPEIRQIRRTLNAYKGRQPRKS